MSSTMGTSLVRYDRNLEKRARANAGLEFLAASSLLRVGLACLAGLSKEEALTKYALDPAGKRYQQLMQDLEGKDGSDA